MNTPLILFPFEPIFPRQVDSMFQAEDTAAKTVGFDTLYYGHDEVIQGQFARSLRRITPHDGPKPRAITLRGWMMTGEQYEQLHEALKDKGYALTTSPTAYNEAHYLPLAYPHISDHTARSEWFEGDDPEQAWGLYHEHFATQDALIKDWVKSAKYFWDEGCFIPAHTTETRFKEIFKVFRTERGKLFNRGVVLREMLELKQLGGAVRGIPHIDEVRLFFWNHELLLEPLARQGSDPMDHRSQWVNLASKFSSGFMTVDVAQASDGQWWVIETGDGGVSGLPQTLDPVVFYSSLWNALHA